MPNHLLVTNDFPPKVGGIQSYLWELWRRLPPGEVTVLTTAHAEAASFDAAQPFRIERRAAKALLPTLGLARHVDRLAEEVGAELVVLDPALPVGALGPRLGRPYVVVVHGSELVGRLPGGRRLMGKVVREAAAVVAAGEYAAAEAARTSEAARTAGAPAPPLAVIPPGVDCRRFVPLAPPEKVAARAALGLPGNALIVVGVSRLVPRKGFDVLVRAAGELASQHQDLLVVIAGQGRDRPRLERAIDRASAPVRLLGRVAEDSLPMLYGAADVFAMCCRTRWGGLEPEGFGIVFLEAAACGIPQVAGASGGAADAVLDGHTGTVVRQPRSVTAVTAALGGLLADARLRDAMGEAGRRRAVADFDYDRLAERLARVIDEAARRSAPRL